jgi:CRISPR-associated protein Csx10
MQQEAALTANQQRVNDIICDICKAYSNARSYNNILNRNEAGPSVTQWRRIQNQVHTQNEQWNVDVFSGQHAICKVDSGELGWGINWYDQSLTNFASHIKNLLAKESAATMTLLLEQLCRYDLSTYKGLKKLVKELNLFMKAV